MGPPVSGLLKVAQVTAATATTAETPGVPVARVPAKLTFLLLLPSWPADNLAGLAMA